MPRPRGVGWRTVGTKVPTPWANFLELLAQAASEHRLSYLVAGRREEIGSKADLIRVAIFVFVAKALIPDLEARGVDVKELWRRANEGGGD